MGASAEQHGWFDNLYRAHRSTVLDYARRRVGDVAAEDVASEVFAACWRHRDDARGVDLPWLITAARNLVLHEYRSAGRQDRLVDRLGGSVVTRPADDPADRVADQLDNAALVSAAMGQLSDTDQELLRLVAWEHLTPREIAAVVGCSGTAARVRIHRASRRLATAMTAYAASTPNQPADHDPLRSAP